MEKPEISHYTTLDFQGWNESGDLILAPKFQRREVWKTPARSYFIDSILKSFPIPPIFLRLAQSQDRTRIVREVIDGQQRLRALLEFYNDGFALSKGVGQFPAKRFSAIPEDAKTVIRAASFICEVFSNISDADVLQVFARVNTYSVPLNAQELRNGKFFGRFKQTTYGLAFEHLEAWRRFKIFSESSIARMNEVELTSELMIAAMAGQQDKKKSIDEFYADNDEAFENESKVKRRFRSVFDAISDYLSDTLQNTEFRRPPLFYTLFCVIHHRLFGLPKETLSTPRRERMPSTEGGKLRDAVLSLSDKITAAKQDEPVSHKDAAFVTACLRQTDNLKPRKVRFDKLYRAAFR